jgi:Transposase, Mutator family
VKKGQRRVPGLDEKIIALYAGGMTTREIERYLAELYGPGVSRDTVSRVTAAVLDDAKTWQTRPLEQVYPIVYLDALIVCWPTRWLRMAATLRARMEGGGRPNDQRSSMRGSGGGWLRRGAAWARSATSGRSRPLPGCRRGVVTSVASAGTARQSAAASCRADRTGGPRAAHRR